jgi:hypothetical protein
MRQLGASARAKANTRAKKPQADAWGWDTSLRADRAVGPQLRQYFLDHVRSFFGTGELLIQTLVLEREALIVDAELMKQGCL